MNPESVFNDYRDSLHFLNVKIEELLSKGWEIKASGFLIAPPEHETTRNHWAGKYIPILYYDKLKKTDIRVLIPHWLLECELSHESRRKNPDMIVETYINSFNYLNKKIDELLAQGWKIKLLAGESYSYGFIVAPDNHKTTRDNWAGIYSPILHHDPIAHTDIKVQVPHWIITCDLPDKWYSVEPRQLFHFTSNKTEDSFHNNNNNNNNNNNDDGKYIYSNDNIPKMAVQLAFLGICYLVSYAI